MTTGREVTEAKAEAEAEAEAASSMVLPPLFVSHSRDVEGQKVSKDTGSNCTGHWTAGEAAE